MIFRWTCAALFALFVLVWLRAALRSGLSKSFFYAAAEGLLLALCIRALLLSCVAVVFLYCAAPALLASGALPLPPVLRWSGALMAAAGIALIHWVFLTLDKGFSTSLHVREKHSLITEGPYRLVRHPMYSAYSLVWLGLSLLAANSWVLLPGVVGLALVMGLRVQREERLLLQSFGEAYRRYCERTPRYLPRFSQS